MSASPRSFRLSSPRSLAKGFGFHASKEQTIGGVAVATAARTSDASAKQLSPRALDGSSDVSSDNSSADKIMEGHLFVRIHVRRRRYCVLRGRTLLVFDSKDDALASAAAASTSSSSSSTTIGAKKIITVVGVRNAAELDKSVRASLFGPSGLSNLENALVISTAKSKLVVVEAETVTEKQRWLHAMSCLNFASSTSEKSFFVALLQDSDSFDAHVAVSLLHQYRDNAVATELVIDRLAEYAERNVDDVEFYIQQIVHLVVNTEITTTEKLVHLLLSICKANAYVEHLGNCIHLALQLFWLLEAKIADKDPKTYNLCAKLLMSIEAKVVNQQFELPAQVGGSFNLSSSSSGNSSGSGAVSALLMEIPGITERLQEMCRHDAAKASATRPEEVTTTTTTTSVTTTATTMMPSTIDTSALTIDTAALAIDTSELDAHTGTKSSINDPMDAGMSPPTLLQTETTGTPSLSPKVLKEQRELVLKWMEKERKQRYKYFHEQRDFVKALADISEAMRLVDPPSERKKHLPAALEALHIPEMAYIPLGRVSDPFSRITRVLADEGTVFSTHSRAPCLLCFEVIEDHVNAAGHRSSMSKTPRAAAAAATSPPVSPRCSSSRGLASEATVVDEETEVIGYIKKFSINGKLLCVDESTGDNNNDDDVASELSESTLRATEMPSAFKELERQLDIGIVLGESDTADASTGIAPPLEPSAVDVAISPRTDMLRSAALSLNALSSSCSSAVQDETNLIRRNSRSAYEVSLSKMLTEGGMFNESWHDKKERIRASSPHGHLPGWNVISLISKSNDDIRQEVFAMQLITKFQDIFALSGLPLYLRPYRIVSTGKTCGLLETITDAQSLDGLKKQTSYKSLRDHLVRTHGGSGPDAATSRGFKTAQRKFLHSLVAYSLVCYLLQIKDRHNGNILLDHEGHVVHIDFGFLLGIAPGGSWSFESAPFKLTAEMVDVLGGTASPVFGDFVQLFVRGLLAAQRKAEQIIALVEIMMRNSTFPCFSGRDVSRDLQRLRERFLLTHSTEHVVKACMKMISVSYKNAWTKRYDQFQKITNGILP